VSVVVIDSGTRRGLVDSAYNARREECEQAAEYFGRASLRELDMDELVGGAPGLSPEAFKRARHVLSENARVLAAAAAMQENNPVTLGRILQEGHTSLRDDFEVSRDEIDILVAIANARPGCYGARMTGGGFGGCVVALVAAAEAEGFVDAVQEKYAAATDFEAKGYVTKPTEGVSAQEI
jgi:galactokinase